MLETDSESCSPGPEGRFSSRYSSGCGLGLQQNSGERKMPTATLKEINPKIRDFMTSRRRMLIDGKWVDAQSGYNIFDASLPFGGYKQSGWGREMGKEAIELYTEVKSVCVKV
jgi:hypothetical protein